MSTRGSPVPRSRLATAQSSRPAAARLERIHHRLQARGIDADSAVREGRYLPADLNRMLSTFTIDGRLDEARFRIAGHRSSHENRRRGASEIAPAWPPSGMGRLRCGEKSVWTRHSARAAVERTGRTPTTSTCSAGTSCQNPVTMNVTTQFRESARNTPRLIHDRRLTGKLVEGVLAAGAGRTR